MNRGFVPETGSGHIAGLDLTMRAGFGLDGVMGPSGDGLVYGAIGFRSDAASSNRVTGASGQSGGGNLSAAIPARWGPTIRLRMPFYVVPGDLLFLSPLYFFNPKAYTNMAVSAGNGGFIPWQVGLPTAVGRFQFVLGRELGVTFYGLSGQDDLIAPSTEPSGIPRIVRFKSTLFDLPILNYQPSRSFSGNQAASWVFQLFIDADVPRGGSVDYPPGAPVPKLQTVWSVGLRLHFDWRHYY